MSDFRARSNTELLDATFAVFRTHFGTFFTITAIAFLPYTIAAIVAPHAVTPMTPGRAALSMYTSPLPLLFFVLGLATSVFLNATITVATSNAYVGQPVDIASAFRSAFARPGALIGAVFLQWLFVTLGFVLFIIPGIIFLLRYFAVTSVVVLEGSSATGALKRSRQLARKHFGKIFLILVAVWLSLAIVYGIVLGLEYKLFGITRMSAIGAITQLIINAAIFPLFPIATTLLYYDLRIRHEGYDLELMSQTLDTSPAAITPALS